MKQPVNLPSNRCHYMGKDIELSLEPMTFAIKIFK